MQKKEADIAGRIKFEMSEALTHIEKKEADIAGRRNFKCRRRRQILRVG
jgi:hypothetical protein